MNKKKIMICADKKTMCRPPASICKMLLAMTHDATQVKCRSYLQSDRKGCCAFHCMRIVLCCATTRWLALSRA